jgi:hypothetical protein
VRCAGLRRNAAKMRLLCRPRSISTDELIIFRFNKRTASLFRLYVRGVVGLNTVKELLTALRMLDVLNANVDPLLNVAVADDFVYNDANCVRRDIVDNTGPAVDCVRATGIASPQ